MKIKEYIKVLQELADQYPDADVIYSSDDEGNRFDHVNYHPTAGYHDEFVGFESGEKVNSICIN